MARYYYAKYAVITKPNRLPTGQSFTLSFSEYFSYGQFTGSYMIHANTPIFNAAIDIPKPYVGMVIRSEGKYAVVESISTMASGHTVGHMRVQLYTDTPAYERGNYITTVQAENSTYPANGRHVDGYWYVRGSLVNQGPSISGNDLDLGSKTSDFKISYMVQDPNAGDVVQVSIQVGGKTLQEFTQTTVGITRSVDIKINDYPLGTHKIIITAKDKAGLTANRTYTFTKTNSAPVISGADTDLGGKSSPFSLTYQVYDENADNVLVLTKFNGVEIQKLTNAPQREDIQVTIGEELLANLEVGKTNTIEISAQDDKGGITYRRYTFIRDNFAPVISGTDTDLGNLSTELNYSFSVSDAEGDAVNVSVYLDDKSILEIADVELEKEYTVTLKGLDFLKIRKGVHTIKIVAKDEVGGKSTRHVQFERSYNRLIMQLKEPYPTDILATKVLIIPGWHVAKGAIAKVEVCNNANDANPVWEDATAMTMNGKAFNVTNTKSDGSPFGVNIRLTIQRGTATTDSYITGVGGAVE